ncbi:hypothetical protein DL767_005391 [Monosporascus sp. MG133]|nr:hypothetical protein DL767_005391 [Monosporascus sp. MG133]
MSSFQSNNNLMGFSVHQPSVGAALQFFPPMGSKELDQMIDAYVPGNASILDKRTVVTCEFVQHSIATGELFKFFLVYPSSVSESFDSPASLQDSGYGSFNTSPVMSEGQWASIASSSRSKPRSPSKKATASDFSHMPGMKIMTKDGVDVTNSASRGCKTKEQRDHAHLMRIIKACESCRKRKVRCDPSHKKRSSSQSQSPEPKSHKKVKKASIAPKAATPQMCASDQTTVFTSASFAGSHNPPPEVNDTPEWMSSFDSFIPTDEIDIFSEMENWDQFINYGDESTAVQQDCNFNVHHFSPTASSTNSTSPSQPLTPATRGLSSDEFEFTSASDFAFDNGVAYAGAFASGEIAPTLPYLNPGGIEGGTNYLDFNLYSPGSTSDEDLGFSKEIAAASPQQESFDRLGGDENDGSYERVSDYRHRSELNDRLPNAGQSTKSIRQSSAAGDRQVSLFSGQEMIPIPGSLHDQSRSSRQSAADATRGTGLAGVDNQHVPAGNKPQPPLIPPRDPNKPHSPPGETVGNSRPIHQRSIHERTIHQVLAESHTTQNSQSRIACRANLQASATSSRTLLTTETRKTMSGESSVTPAVDVTDDPTHVRERHMPSVALKSNSLQTSTALPEQGNLVSRRRRSSGRSSTRADLPRISRSTSAEATSLSTSAEATSLSSSARTYSTRSSAKQGRFLLAKIANTRLSSAHARRAELRDDAHGAGFAGIQYTSYNVAAGKCSDKTPTGLVAAFTYSEKTRCENTGLLAAFRLHATHSAASQGTSLMSTAGLYKSKQRSFLGGEESRNALHRPDRAEIAVFICLTALALFSRTAAPTTVGTMFVIAALVGLWRQTSRCANKLDLSAQPLSFAGQFTVGSTGVRSCISDTLQRFSHFRCVMGGALFSQPSVRKGRRSWTGLSKAYGSGTYNMG